MDIAYPAQSKFLEACEAAIHEQKGKLQAGRVVRIDVPSTLLIATRPGKSDLKTDGDIVEQRGAS